MIFIKSLEYIYYSNIEIIKNKQGSQTTTANGKGTSMFKTLMN